jgi:ABC-type phosphate/phosphonate transport system substrate-binding protein
MNLFRAVLAPFAQGACLFTRVLETGAHARSLAAVIASKADVASIDVVTFALLRDRFPGVDRRVRILARTPVTPGLPLVTASSTPAGTVAALRRALAT